MKTYSFLREAGINDGQIDPNLAQNSQDPNMVQQQNPAMMDMQGGDPTADFEPLIKSAADAPHSKEKADILKTVAQIRQIEAQTKETLARAAQPPADAMMDDGSGQQIDPMTGQPIDPSMMNGQIDPMTGMPMSGDPQTQDNGPLAGLGDGSAPADPMGGQIDPMTGMPMGGVQKTFTAVGRAYKLKKIYDILDKLSNFLHTTPDTKLQEISKQIDESFELFRLVINNLKLYKDQIDDLIIMYYSLLKDICVSIEDVYKQRKLESSVTESLFIKNDLIMLGEGIED